MKCPTCGNKTLQKALDGTVKIRTQGPITVDDTGAKAQCYWCKAEIRLPLTLKKSEEPEQLVIILDKTS